jgi:hypothetical protein
MLRDKSISHDAELGDWDTILERSSADTEGQVQRLADRIMAEVEQDLEAEGESRSREQLEGLRWGAEVISKKVYGLAEPLIYVSPLDTGVGKTLLTIAATRVIMRDPNLSHVGIVIFVNRKELIDEIIRRIGLEPGDPRLAVYIAQTIENFRWNSLGVGSDPRLPGTKLPYKIITYEDGTKHREPNPNYLPPPQDKAQLLITTQALLKSRSRWQPNFADNDLWHYHGEPRPVRIWDETVPPTTPQTLTVGQLKAYAEKLPLGVAEEVLAWAEKLCGTPDDTAVLVPQWSDPLGKNLRRRAKPKDNEPEEDQLLRSVIWQLSGRTVRVHRDKFYKATAITYSDILPRNFTPLLVLDAKADQKEVYREWRRGRGNLVFGPSGRKDCPIFVKHWDRAAGREQHRTPAEREQLAEGAARAYVEALGMGAEQVLLAKYKMDKPSYDIEEAVREAIAALGADDSRLVAVTWGGSTTATNAFKDIAYQIHVGQLQAPLKEYMALQRGASGTRDHEPFDWAAADKVRQTEVAAEFHQTVGRGAVRKMQNGKCTEPMHIWTIFSQRGRMRLRRSIFEQFSEVTFEDWHPLGTELRGGSKKSKNREPFFRLLMQLDGAWFEAKGFEPEFSRQMVRRFLTDDQPFLAYLAAQGLKVEAKDGGKRRGGPVILYRIVRADP